MGVVPFGNGRSREKGLGFSSTLRISLARNVINQGRKPGRCVVRYRYLSRMRREFEGSGEENKGL